MKKIDLTGQKFGNVTVIKEAPPRIEPSGRRKIMWECLCDCGKTFYVQSSNLRGGHTTSCGCKAGRISHINERFGRLITLQHIGGKYLCQCDCGNTVLVETAKLTNGNTKSCGCLQRDKASEYTYEPLVGQKFGKLTVLERVGTNRYHQVIYQCLCDCGSQTIVAANNLRKGITNSCGCIKSKGEMLIGQYLTKNKIQFYPEYSHDQIVLSSGRRPRFDFALFKNDKLCGFIEYHGRQHYNYTNEGWNTEENYKDTQRRDNEKSQACRQLNIPLYIIPYWEIDNIDYILNNIIKELKMEEAQDEMPIEENGQA